MKGLISDKVQIKVNDNNYQGEKLDSLTNENSRFDVVTSTTEDSNSYGNVIFDGQGYTTMSNGNTNSLNPGDMPLNSFLTAGSTLSDNANGKPEGDSLTGLNDRGLLTNSRMNTLDYGDFRPNNNDWNRKMTLADSEDIPKSGNRSGLFSELPQTTEDVLSQIFGRTVVSDKLKETMFAELPESGRNNSLKRSDLAQHGVTHDPPVQTNVPNYYGKLKKSANGNSFRETDVGLMQTTFGPRRGMRSKSSELPLRKNANVSKSFG